MGFAMMKRYLIAIALFFGFVAATSAAYFPFPYSPNLSPIPVNSVAPSISGTLQVGATLTSSTGTWSNCGSCTYSYTWSRTLGSVTDQTGATATYVPVAADINSTLTVSVVATNSGGASSPVTSAATSTGWYGVVLPAGTNLFVSTTGTNSGNCQTSSAPCQTITYGYGQASAGYTINVAAGTYTDSAGTGGIQLTSSGSSGNLITLRSTVLRAAIIDCQNAAFATRQAGVTFYGNYNVLDGFTVRNCAGGGISSTSSTTPAQFDQVLHNEVYAIGGPSTGVTGQGGTGIGWEVNGSWAAQINIVFDGNYVHDCGSSWDDTYDHGFYTNGSGNIYINNIASHNLYGSGIQISSYHPTTNVHVYNNIVYANGHPGMYFWDPTGGSNFTNSDIVNNVIMNNGSQGINANNLGSGDTGLTANNNIEYGNGNADCNCGSAGGTMTFTGIIASDPKFVSPGHPTGDTTGFKLQAGSPGIGVGTTEAIVITDIAKTIRTVPYDIGAYKYP